MNVELVFKCGECDFVANETEEFNAHIKEHGFPQCGVLDSSVKWTASMVKVLIMLFVDNRKKYGDIHWTNRRIWASIASVMCGMGYLVNPHQCSEKWRNLKKTYIKIRDTIGKTGSRRNKWEYYYEMEGALEENTENTTASTQENSRTETVYNDEISDTPDNSDNAPTSTPESSKTVPVFIEVKPSASQVSNQENYISEPISIQENSKSFKMFSLEHSTDPLQTSSSGLFNFTSEVHQLKGPTSPPDSPIPPFQTYHQDICEENCLKRKLPPTEWYDKYLEELRATRHDKNKRHQDKQNFRQQLLDLCKQMLISPTNNTIKTEISS